MTDIPWPGSTIIAYLAGSPVAVVAPDASLFDAATLLTEGDVGALVVGDGPKPQGLLSERDLVHAIAAGKDLSSTKVIDVASTELLWCDASATVDEVAAEMRDHFVRHILVEEDGKLCGVVSARDLLGVYCPDTSFD